MKMEYKRRLRATAKDKIINENESTTEVEPKQ